MILCISQGPPEADPIVENQTAPQPPALHCYYSAWIMLAFARDTRYLSEEKAGVAFFGIVEFWEFGLEICHFFVERNVFQEMGGDIDTVRVSENITVF